MKSGGSVDRGEPASQYTRCMSLSPPIHPSVHVSNAPSSVVDADADGEARHHEEVAADLEDVDDGDTIGVVAHDLCGVLVGVK